MKYQKPSAQTIEVEFRVDAKADDQSSCAGGHCVKATYQNDPWGRIVKAPRA